MSKLIKAVLASMMLFALTVGAAQAAMDCCPGECCKKECCKRQ